MRNLTILILGLAFAAASLAAQIVPAQQAGVPQGLVPQGAAQQPQLILKPGVALIVGKVVEAGSTAGVAGAMVTLSGGALGPSTAMFSSGVPGGERRVTADAQGQFLFRDLPSGVYNINTTAAGYIDGAYGETRVITIRRTLDLVRPVEITDADKTISVRIQMWKTGGISGTFFDEAGEPIVGAPVSVFARMTDWGGPVMQSAGLFSLVTDDRGMYHADVVPGDYIVGLLGATTTVPIAAVEGFQQAMAEGGPALQRYLTETQGGGGPSILPRGAGARIGNFMVMPRSNNLAGMPTLISLNGRLMSYTSAFHPSSLTPATATLVNVQSGEEKSGIDVRVPLIEARRVSGQVIGPTGPQGGATLILVAPDPAVARTSPATLTDTPQALADSNGNFTFIGVAPGTYTLRVVRAGQASADPLLWAAEQIAVASDADVASLQIVLRTGARISGRIVVEGTGAKPPTAQQLRAMLVTARPVPGSLGSLMGTLRQPTERPDETRFITSQNVPGPYMMNVTGIPPGHILKSVTAAGQNIADKQFDLSASGLNDVIVTITDQISTVTGVARDDSGKGAPLATVAVFPADKSLWRLPGMASRRVQVAAPARDGRYTFRGLPAGEYIVVAADWPAADFSDGNVLTRLIPSGSRLTLGDGESRTQDLRVTVIK